MTIITTYAEYMAYKRSKQWITDLDSYISSLDCPSCGREILSASQIDIGLCMGCNGN